MFSITKKNGHFSVADNVFYLKMHILHWLYELKRLDFLKAEKMWYVDY